jgi:hypothetical protein
MDARNCREETVRPGLIRINARSEGIETLAVDDVVMLRFAQEVRRPTWPVVRAA